MGGDLEAPATEGKVPEEVGVGREGRKEVEENKMTWEWPSNPNSLPGHNPRCKFMQTHLARTAPSRPLHLFPIGHIGVGWGRIELGSVFH